MESAPTPNPTLTYLTKPKIPHNLPYISTTKQVYVNLFKISIKKELKLYQYPYSVTPEIEAGDLIIRNNIFKKATRQLKSIYGECFISGDSLYAVKDIKEIKSVVSKLYSKSGRTDYTVNLQPRANVRTINEKDIQNDQLAKQCIEILIRDILRSNPNLDFYKGLFVRRDQKKTIQTDRVSVNFYPGFTTSFMETDSGNYLNVTLKNKIISTDHILKFLKENNYNDKNNHNKIRDLLIGRSFKVSYAKKNYVIDDITFDANPENTDFKKDDGTTMNLVKYYKESHQIDIKDKKQPLILVKKYDPQLEIEKTLYFIPELCNLAGLDDSATKDFKFMKKLADFTKLNPSDRVKKTNEFLDLLKDDKKSEEHPERGSAKEKSEAYGIEVKAVDKMFEACYMKDAQLVAANNKAVHPKDKLFKVLEKKDMSKYVCFYEKSNYDDADYLNKTLCKAASGYGLTIAEPEWVEMRNRSSAREWIDTASEYIGNGKNDYSFAVFLLGKNDYIYKDLKKHSLCTNGYVSQVVKARSLEKNAMSVCSKILLQINAKLDGISYKVKMDKNISDRKLMVIGVDSSHIKGKRTGVAMVATVNDSFTTFFNKEEIIKEETKDQLQFCVSKFIEEALVAYKKNNKELPKGIIIYRQGVSLQQKELLKNEVAQIKNTCETKKVLYYYILVNTKTTYKFFETKKGTNEYSNPAPGLLIMDGITNRNFFEFYIQPQQVTGGSATPTCFHVAYGDLNFAEMVPKFTYDLCHIYSNWQGTVRIPNVIKAAEKLSKMTAKYTLGELNENLKLGQAYL